MIGAGLAGLACAIAVLEAGEQAIVYEMARQAGGRCRSFYDPRLERYLDNGTHMIIGANTGALQYIDRLHTNHFTIIAPAVFPFLDLENGECWTLRPNSGRLPWWLLHSRRRVAKSRFIDYLSVFRLLWGQMGGCDLTVADYLSGPLMQRLWKPITEATLNTAPEEASAALFARVIGNSLMLGEHACRPYLARHGLGPALIEPALSRITAAGGIVQFGSRLRTIYAIAKVLRLHFDTGVVETKVGDSVVLALPPWEIATLWPELSVPTAFRAIVNVHYRLDRPVRFPGGLPFLALVGGLAQWLFIRGDVLSVTVSAANALATQTNAVVAHKVWADCATALALPLTPMPLARVIKEKRATLAHTPASNGRIVPPPPLPGLVLAGDWTCPYLPATIEAAVISGARAAAQVLGLRL
ncbi:Squalene-associated FAD-dependent desaturase, HpnE [invertebrate metagenome]|uniref:Squalene-associated FAD-dependent desaturase, HpnE n=1 Tax=invertebrate metagenome TaxID=1711999 RepID=A0A484HC48_9ZZZZ